MRITPLEDADIPAIVDLWQRCNLARPWNDSAGDIALARRDGNSDVLVGRDGDSIVASVLVGHDGHRGWVYYVAVDPDHQGKDFGRGIMAAAEDWLRKRGIAKLMLLVRGDNTPVKAFYEHLGFDAQDRVIYAKWLDGREPTP